MAEFFRKKYKADKALATAWRMPGVTFSALATGIWNSELSAVAETELESFSTIWISRYFEILSAACKRVDPHHLNLGARYYRMPPEWALQGMKWFDVFSINCYQPRVPQQALARIGEVTGRPTLIGEWHFGATDAGLPAAGMARVETQDDRAKAYRVYLECRCDPVVCRSPLFHDVR